MNSNVEFGINHASINDYNYSKLRLYLKVVSLQICLKSSVTIVFVSNCTSVYFVLFLWKFSHRRNRFAHIICYEWWKKIYKKSLRRKEKEKLGINKQNKPASNFLEHFSSCLSQFLTSFVSSPVTDFGKFIWICFS